MKPWQIVWLSLPPWLRYKAKYMFCFAVIPNNLKLDAAKKFYDFAANYEMNSLHLTGICGIRVIMYGTSLDSPGRRELLCMQSVQSYYPCPMCLHTWQPGPRRIIHGGYRRFLPPLHPWRQKTFQIGTKKYQFRDVERRALPNKRTDALVSLCILRATKSKPFLGHKGMPLLSSWVGADWARSMCDKMHDLKCFCEMLLKGYVGKGDGIYGGWGCKDAQHREDCRVFGIFPDFVAGGLPPWRLTRDERRLMDQRVKTVWWTHYCDKLAWRGHSFWSKTDRIWKAKHKILCLTGILPTCLRGFVVESHLALLYVVDAIRQLDGQCYSIEESKRLGVSPHDALVVAAEENIKALGTQLLEGLVLMEGSFPVSHLNPAMHHLVHYASETARMGSLGWVAMNPFERNNKRMKNLVRSTRHPETSLASQSQVDNAARVSAFAHDLVDSPPPPLVRFKCRITGGLYVPTPRQRCCMSLLGVTNFVAIQAFKVAWVRGIHFSCGEWGQHTCGSVFTTVWCGRSVYGVLDHFLLVDGVRYAAVTWLSPPYYPFAPILLVVRVRRIPACDQPLNRCVIRVDSIEPCGVNVMPDEDGVHYYMMRTRGFDRRPRE